MNMRYKGYKSHPVKFEIPMEDKSSTKSKNSKLNGIFGFDDRNTRCNV